jgi:hypothetical protein
MNDFKEEFIFYGDDVRIERFPSDTRFIYANPPLYPVDRGAVSEALDNPLNADPLEKMLKSSSRVTIAFDDPCVPIPLMRADVRGLVIGEVLRRLFRLGIERDQIRLICANGLHRKWTLQELSIVLGKGVVREMGAERISCHDATRDAELISLGTTDSGMEVEINRAVEESDITIYVNLNFTSMNGGWKSILVGLGSYRSIRHHHTPRHWSGEFSIMDPEKNLMHRALGEMSSLIRKRYNIFQIECVVNNQIWPPPLDRVLCPIGSGNRDAPPGFLIRTMLSLASYSPRKLKRMIRNSLRSDYRLCAVSAGDVDAVHQKTLEILFRQQNVVVDEPVDILILGIPNLSPYSVQSIFNPILLRHLVLAYMRELFRNRPLVKEGGIIVAYNPGLNRFHQRHHPSYIDFWERDLAQFYDPEKCWNELAEPYAQNPEYIGRYQHDYAYHGTHALMLWMWSGMGLRRLKGVILAGAREPNIAQKIGFVPAPDLNSALAMAREMAGSESTMAYQVIPPLFCADLP